MKKQFTILVSLTFLTVTTALCQNEIASNISPNNSLHIAESESKVPAFIGGKEALTQYLQENIVYPEKAKNLRIEGMVVIQYDIQPDGSIENVLVVKSVHQDLDEEAVRVIKSMPNWSPGIRNGQPEAVCYQLPIHFTIDF